MRVLHVTSSLDPRSGGPTSAILGMARAQVQAGVDVTILATFHVTSGRPPVDVFENAGIKVHLIGPATGPLSRHPDIRAKLDDLITNTDLVHIHAMWEEIQHQAARAAMSAGRPYIATPHGMLDQWSIAQGRLKKLLYLLWRGRKNLQRARAIHFATATEMQQSAHLRLKPKPFVEPFGINTSEFDRLPAKGTFRKKFSIATHRPLILFLGRIHSGKGMEHLVPALAAMKNKDAIVAVVGPDSGGFKATIEDLIRFTGVGDRVVFTGMQSGDDRLAALVDADVLCLPSDHENFGLVVIEALAAGTPVVISDQVYICGEIANAEVGLVVSLNIPELAAALDRVLGDPNLRNQMGQRGFHFVREQFDWKVIGARWARRYADVAADQ